MVEKPVALWNTAPHATHAHASLTEALRTMSARLVPEAELSLALRGRSAEDIVADPIAAGQLVRALDPLPRLTRLREPPEHP